MKKLSFLLFSFALCALLMSGANLQADDSKLTIKKIMKEAFKGPLVKKVGKGQASADEKQKLLDYAKAMQGMTAPKGDADSWKMKTAAVTAAAQAAVDGADNASALLMKATNCAACHKPHKP